MRPILTRPRNSLKPQNTAIHRINIKPPNKLVILQQPLAGPLAKSSGNLVKPTVVELGVGICLDSVELLPAMFPLRLLKMLQGAKSSVVFLANVLQTNLGSHQHRMPLNMGHDDANLFLLFRP